MRRTRKKAQKVRKNSGKFRQGEDFVGCQIIPGIVQAVGTTYQPLCLTFSEAGMMVAGEDLSATAPGVLVVFADEAALRGTEIDSGPV